MVLCCGVDQDMWVEQAGELGRRKGNSDLYWVPANPHSISGLVTLYYTNYSVILLHHPVQFSLSVMSDSLWPHGVQHARPPCPPPTPGVYPNSCPLSLWHLVFCRPLLLLPPISPSIRVFSNESALQIRWPKYWSFSFNISPSNEHSGPISPRMDWLDLAVQGTLKSFLHHHSSKASILRCSAFFFFFFKLFILLYNTALVLSYINMNLPQVYMS